MTLEFTPYALPFILAAVVSVITAVYVWPRHRSDAGALLIFMTIAMAVWTTGYSLELMAVELDDKLFWTRRRYIGMTFTPYFWMLFALALIFPTLNRQNLRWLAFIPLTTTLLAFTNDWHGLVWQEVQIVVHPSFSVLQFSRTIGFWFNYLFTILFSLVGAAALLYGLKTNRRLSRYQQITLLTGLLIPWAPQILFQLGLSPLPNLDLTPAAFSLSAIAFAIVTRGHTLADPIELARQRLTSGMPTGFVTVNAQGFVADMNDRAADIIGVPVNEALGQRVAALLAPWPHLQPMAGGETVAAELLTVGQDAGRQTYTIQFTPLAEGPGQPFAGQLITLQPTDDAMAASDKPTFAGTAFSKTAFNKTDRPPAPAFLPEAPGESLDAPKIGYAILQPLVNFFIPRPLEQIAVTVGENPRFNQLLEQTFTAMLRVASVFFALGLLAALSYLGDSGVVLPFAAAIALLGFFAIARRIPLIYRGWGFLLALYFAALVELANYGYSLETFIFFMTITVLAVLLQGGKGGFLVLSANIAILVVAGWQIAAGNYHPASLAPGTAPPTNTDFAIAALAVYIASASILVAAVATLMRGVNLAWREESQARHLLRQERDALDRRVVERTQQLAASEANLRTFIQANPAIMMQVNREGRILFAHIPGMDEPMLQSMLGQSLIAVSPPEAHADIQQALARVFTEQETFQYEGQSADPVSGEPSTYLVSVAPVLHNGQAASAILLTNDITARKEAEIALNQLYQVIATPYDNADAQFTNALRIGAELLGLPLGIISRIEADSYVVLHAFASDGGLQPGQEFHFPETICAITYQTDDLVTIEHMGQSVYKNHPCYGAFGLEAYIGAPLYVEGKRFGTLNFSGPTMRQTAFTPAQKEFVLLMGQWVSAAVERELADQRLADSEAQFRTLVSNIPGISYRCLADEQWTMLFMSDGAQEVTGYPAADFINNRVRTFSDCIHPADRQYVSDIVAEGLQNDNGLVFEMEYRLIHADGRIRWVREKGRGVYDADGALRHLDGAIFDITDRKQAEEQQKATLAAIPDLLFRFDKAGVFLDYHSPINDVLLLPPEMFIGRQIGEVLPPPVVKPFRAALQQAAEADQLVQFEYQLDMPDGQHIFETRLTAVNEAEFLALVRDVTERAQARQELIEINQQLDQFAYIVSHDLKAPLRAIANLSTWIEEDLGNNLSEDIAENMTLLRQRVDFMRRMIDGILAYSRAGRQTTSVEEVDSDAVARQIIGMLDAPAFTFTVADPLPIIRGERVKLEQLFSNLIGNSVKYHDRPDGRIEVTCVDQTPMWEFAVADDGPGIDPVYHDKIFDLFHTVEANKQADSAGIGLAIARKIVEEGGGRIWLESTPGAGATFRFTWPKG